MHVMSCVYGMQLGLAPGTAHLHGNPSSLREDAPGARSGKATGRSDRHLAETVYPKLALLFLVSGSSHGSSSVVANEAVWRAWLTDAAALGRQEHGQAMPPPPPPGANETSTNLATAQVHERLMD